MQVYDDIPESPLTSGGRSVAVGVFDGVHIGHQELLRRAVRTAEDRGLRPLVLTFDRHPLEVLNPNAAPNMLTTLEEKLALIAELGVDEIVVARATPALLNTDAEEFVRRVLSSRLRAAYVVCGWSFRFGRGRQGTPDLLRKVGAELGLEADVLPPVLYAGEPVSSTRVREALARGDVETVAALLGRPHFAEGEVVRGAGRGRALGIPTANLETPAWKALPARGVYTAQASVDGKVHRAVVNIGTRPTFGDGTQVLVEAHLLDFSGDLYGRRVRVSFSRRLRDERKFSSADELKRQIADDIAEARRV
ncbi:MAG: bifunctional riboflavin kinase/FAD synthetase [Armatimonadota bacterium]